MSEWSCEEKNGLNLWTSGLLREAGLVHAMTGAGFNLSTTHGPGATTAAERRKDVCKALGLDAARLTTGQQVHGAELACVGASTAASGGAPAGSSVPHVDGLVTDVRGVPLMALSADCPLVVLFDPAQAATPRSTPGRPRPFGEEFFAIRPSGRRPRESTERGAVVGVIHAGWRGAVACIVDRLVEIMVSRYGCDRTSLRAAISPSAGPCCYEVKEDVLRVAALRWPDAGAHFPRRSGKLYLNLWSALAAQLVVAGIPSARLDVARICSICDKRFFSFRRDGAKTGHAGLIACVGVE